MTFSSPTEWLGSVSAFLTGAGDRDEIERASTDWLAENDSPSSLLRLADPPNGATRDELEQWISDVFDEVGDRPTSQQLPWIAAAIALIRTPEDGARKTAGRLASIAINFDSTAKALTTALVLSDDLDDGVVGPPGGVEDSLGELRKTVAAHVEALQVSGWQSSVDEMVAQLATIRFSGD